jgi:pilus assembly protein CpaB
VNAKLTLGLAVLAGLVAVFFVQRYVSGVQGETITVFKAGADQYAGEVLTSVEEVVIPATLFPDLLNDAPTSELTDYVMSTPLRANVNAGELLLYQHFDSAVDPGVRSEIPPGMKAISITVDEVSSVAYFVQPGDLVDVLGTFAGSEQLPGGGPQTNTAFADISTRPIVQAVRVLAVGGQHRRSERQVLEPYSSVTLLVSMEEAAKLVFARDLMAANMTLVLRGEGDTSVAEQLPRVGMDTLDFDSIGNSRQEAAQ